MTARRPAAGAVPTLRHARSLLRQGHRLVAGMDEVGRGSLAGPVTVGVVVVAETTRTAPSGVRDSKLLAPAARQALVPRIRRWAPAWAVGHAEPEEIDRYGIIAALRLAGRRALAALPDPATAVLLDGSHDWLSLPIALPDDPPHQPDAPAQLCLDVPVEVTRRLSAPYPGLATEPAVETMVKADLRCAVVAAASILAKVERDAIMTARAADHPGYGWEGNKGYAAPDHLDALRALGPSTQHRRSWSLPGVAPQLTDA